MASLSPPVGRRRSSWPVRKSVERPCAGATARLVLEDIHWAGPTLLDLLEHLTDSTRDAPLLVLCLARPELLDDTTLLGRKPAERRTADAPTRLGLEDGELDSSRALPAGR